MRDPGKLLVQPQLHMRDGRIIRSFADAIALLREHEARPGVDVRDEVLHRLERAQTEKERQAAADAFVAWAAEIDLFAGTTRDRPSAGVRSDSLRAGVLSTVLAVVRLRLPGIRSRRRHIWAHDRPPAHFVLAGGLIEGYRPCAMGGKTSTSS